jgi:GBP family porin
MRPVRPLAGGSTARAPLIEQVTLYDRRRCHLHEQSGWRAQLQETSGAVNGSRWGLRGSEDLGGGLKAIFTLENGFSIATASSARTAVEFGRQAFVGLSSDQFGAVTLGRQYDSVVDYLGSAGTDRHAIRRHVQAAHPFDNDNLDNSFRVNNSVKFQSANYGGFKFGGLYGFSNATRAGSRTTAHTGIGASAGHVVVR